MRGSSGAPHGVLRSARTMEATQHGNENHALPTVSTDGLRTVLFVCRGNSVRSKMAAAFAEQLLGDSALILSAGLAPKASIKPGVQEVMGSIYRLQLKGPPMPVSAYTDERVDVVVALCEEELDLGAFSRGPPLVVRWDVAAPSQELADVAARSCLRQNDACSACDLPDSAAHARAVYSQTAANIKQLVEQRLPPLLRSLAA
eukprot:jgi/Tetstr1/444008/TSEL_031948.t1